ncbi:MAG TPA: anti-phage dCTP deaminase [Telluria sp.]|nr:anti-phage dCTP deaminase [Telluria sp.]
MDFRQSSHDASELVMGIIGPVGCNRQLVVQTIKDLATHYSYRVIQVSLSKAAEPFVSVPPHNNDEYMRVTNLMAAGNELRRRTGDKAIFAKFAAMQIGASRPQTAERKIIYLIDSLKRPEEVEELRNIYGDGFFLFAIHSAEDARDKYLEKHCHILDVSKRKRLIDLDKDDRLGHGQATSDAFHLADFFVAENGSNEKIWNTMERFFDLIFGNPFLTPTFSEYAMFMAYVASMKSADMSRQVGAVLALADDIISTGANECPKAGGGSYWPVFDESSFRIYDVDGGRDYMNGFDKNGQDKEVILAALRDNIPDEVKEILEENIAKSGINDLTEFGRVVHAEMDAILGCARRGVSCRDAVLFSTTFPCHNCAKHIISSGVKKVVYIEPYPKSRALEGHKDSIRTRDTVRRGEGHKVLFTPFIGVGPKRFVDLFSMTLGSGEKLRRKEKSSVHKIGWERSQARPRVKMFDASYVTNEKTVTTEATESLSKIEKVVIT